MAKHLAGNCLRQFCTVLASAIMLLQPRAQLEAQARTAVLRRGQVVPLEAMQEITSKTAHPGDRVPFKTTRALVAEGVTLLPEGSILYGRVSAAHPASGNCQGGRLDWKLERIALATGQNVRTRFAPDYISDFGPIPDRVSFPSTGHKIRIGVVKGAEMTGLTGFVVALSPLLIPMAIAMKEPCEGRRGDEGVIRKNEHFYLAVSKTTKITR